MSIAHIVQNVNSVYAYFAQKVKHNWGEYTLEFFERNSDVSGGEFDNFVVGVVLVLGNRVGANFGFDEVEIVCWGIDGEGELDTVVHGEAGVFSGGLDGADKVADVALFFELGGEGFV